MRVRVRNYQAHLAHHLEFKETSVADSNDEERALLDAYTRATSPSPLEVERALTRTLARIESSERPASVPDRRHRFVWIAAASVATLAMATGAFAGVRWYRAHAQPEPGVYGAARLDRVDQIIHVIRDAGDRAAAYQRPELAAAVPEPTPEPSSDSDSDSAPPPAPADRVRSKHSAANEVPTSDPPPSDPPTSAVESSALAEESRLLTRVRRALAANDFEAALEWAEEHARRHPHGGLIEERLILEAVAACRGGQSDRGLAAAKQLREQFPKTAALAKVDQACVPK